jgi:hypothetical protein
MGVHGLVPFADDLETLPTVRGDWVNLSDRKGSNKAGQPENDAIRRYDEPHRA